MSNRNKQNDHKANQANSNKGTSGHNTAYQKALDNRANQLNPNNSRYQGKK
ncbi:alpha-amylase [Vibrio parahaemolyticus]|nr:alpha-amylase [Vibrio parahaemolyticus]MBE3704463.1 alpha-amylase [Vibrio parahaemolyticus]MBE3769554.1 alpha-amylase [Vibrio parahaemolyticus]HCG7481694.1 alpha-amylase [Vibrio parahaemolyticus]HCH2618165.1 alpha-amylase [Vibrio parahaemolyticus]